MQPSHPISGGAAFLSEQKKRAQNSSFPQEPKEKKLPPGTLFSFTSVSLTVPVRWQATAWR